MIKDKYGRNAQSAAMREMLGLGAHLPAEGTEPREIQGYLVWVEPAQPRLHGRARGGMHHRIMAKCQCGEILSAGRTHQHKCRGE